MLHAGTRSEIRAFKIRLQQNQYDYVVDTQGLIKSAAITLFAKGTRCGYAWSSAREPLASLFYDHTYEVTKNLHAVVRNRHLAAQALGYIPATALNYGIKAPDIALPWLTNKPYAVLLHATSRDDKLWPESDWVALGLQLNKLGITSILPWGNTQESQRSRRLAQQIPHAIVPSPLQLGEVAALLAGAKVVIGVDTGIAHLAAALHVPVIGLYCTTNPALTGILTSGPGINLGGIGKTPTLATVIAETERVMVNA